MANDFPVKGLPDGVVFTGDFHPAGPNDFELIRVGEEVAIYKGARFGQAASGVKVTPADGWTFAPTGELEKLWDIKGGVPKDGRPAFVPAKMIAPRDITATAKFHVDNEYTLEKLKGAMEAIKQMPGYVSCEVDA